MRHELGSVARRKKRDISSMPLKIGSGLGNEFRALQLKVSRPWVEGSAGNLMGTHAMLDRLSIPVAWTLFAASNAVIFAILLAR